MNRKLIYAAFLLVILAGIMVPAIYTHKMSSQKQAEDSSAGGEAVSSREAVQAPSGSESQNGVKPAPPAGLQPDKILSAGDTADRKGNSTGRDGQGAAVPVKEPAGAPAAGTDEDGYKVGIAVVGMNGELLYGPASETVTGKDRWGRTAMSALDATGLPYSAGSWYCFVEAVAGQRNKGQSGWMYKVNGEIPMVAADQIKIKAGDQVIWWYSKKMGDPSPDWDDLMRRRPPLSK